MPCAVMHALSLEELGFSNETKYEHITVHIFPMAT